MQAMMPTRVEERARGRLHLTDRSADSLLSKALDSALVGNEWGRADDQVFSIPVAARKELPALVVHVVPIRRRARATSSPAPRASCW